MELLWHEFICLAGIEARLTGTYVKKEREPARPVQPGAGFCGVLELQLQLQSPAEAQRERETMMLSRAPLALLLLFTCVLAGKPSLRQSASARTPAGASQPSSVSMLEFPGRGLRFPRGDSSSKERARFPRPPPQQHRHTDPDAFFTTPRTFNGSLRVHNPLFPVTDESAGAYGVVALSLAVFSVGAVANLALMCIVCNGYQLQSTWNGALAALAFWDFTVLFFCLPVVVFHELGKRRLMGDLSCRAVPFIELPKPALLTLNQLPKPALLTLNQLPKPALLTLNQLPKPALLTLNQLPKPALLILNQLPKPVTSLGVATFTLCALSIERFQVVTSTRPRQQEQLESGRSILSKLSVIWVGSLILAAPEMLTWRLEQRISPSNGLPVDYCVQQPAEMLPETLFSLMLTYHEARTWWTFGCFFCLPLLFCGACQLLTRHVTYDIARSAGKRLSLVSSSTLKKQHLRERQLSRTVVALAAVYAACRLPEHAWSIALSYVEAGVATRAHLTLIGQFLMFARSAATPVLLLCITRSLGRAFMDCCCCCCDECLPDSCSTASSLSSTNATAISSTLSSPVSLPDEKLKVVSGSTAPAVFLEKVQDGPDGQVIGTPC
ncbi:hypothetical protein DNTS_029362 [Danionella cerebrum]|uniref:G-protein coupled receptors family 1 profile domain-containing protein n=1 Tax=Danionella cerebrum TaxID=2873325 RepID=A0A553Q7X2_9TELE|nr:hypothetical protein DNTS_029362 [Danionella translucida]